jgi:hypothetical protein
MLARRGSTRNATDEFAPLPADAAVTCIRAAPFNTRRDRLAPLAEGAREVRGVWPGGMTGRHLVPHQLATA